MMLTYLPKGFTARPLTLDDVQDVVALLNVCDMQLVGKEEHNVERLLVGWQEPGFDPATDGCVVVAPDGTPDGALVGYAYVRDTTEPHVQIWSGGQVYPAYRELGIGTSLLHWAQVRASKAILKAPPNAQVALFGEALDSNVPSNDLLANEGFVIVRRGWRMLTTMEGPPPSPIWPEGIHVRTADLDVDLVAIAAADREAFRDHWGFVETPVEEELEQWRHWVENDPDIIPALWLLAIDGDEIAGMSLCYPKTDDDPRIGYIGDLSVRRRWRCKGLGLALLHHSFGEFYTRGIHKVALHTDSENLTGATRLYERAGMRVDRCYNQYRKVLRPGIDLSTQSVR